MESNSFFPRQTGASRILYFVMLLCTSMWSCLAVAESSVLVINSDDRIGKYHQTLKGFSENSMLNIVVLDMGNDSTDKAKISEAISSVKPDLIYAIGAKAYLAGYELKEHLPLLFSSLINWRRLPKDDKVYGVAMEVPLDYQFSMYSYFFPDVKNIGVVYSKKYNRELVSKAVETSRSLGIQLQPVALDKANELSRVLKEMDGNVDALWLIADPVVLSSANNLGQIFEITTKASIPVFSYEPAFQNYGTTITISADPQTIGRQSMAFAQAIVQRKTVAGIQDPVGTHIILNLKQVKAFHLKLNEEALDSVTKLIQ
jgi:putative ABC transport system substrate-binding protein